MSFLLDPFLAFMLGIVFSFVIQTFKLNKGQKFVISAIAISLATSYSILLYLDIVHTDFLILDSFAKILPIEQQFGPRIMFHSNFSEVTSDAFPTTVVVVFYCLYFLWFYLGFKSFKNVTAPHEPTPRGSPTTASLMRIGGLLVFASAGMMLFFFIMIPLDKVVIGDALGAKAPQEIQNQEAAVEGYMGRLDAKFISFTDSLCNPDKVEIESFPQVRVERDSAIIILLNEMSGMQVGGIPSSASPTNSQASTNGISIQDVRAMCDARELVGAEVLFIFVNISTWMFLIAFFMLSTPQVLRSKYWNYGRDDNERRSLLEE